MVCSKVCMNIKFPCSSSKFAVNDSHLDCLSWFHKNGSPWDITLIAHAASIGHVMCIQYIVSEDDSCRAMVTDWLDHWDCDPKANYNLNALKQMHRLGSRLDERATAHAAREGKLDCLTFLHEQGVPSDETATRGAALHGKLECLRYLRDVVGCPWDETAVAAAALYGRVNILRYLLDNGCAYDERATASAAQWGMLSCLHLLRERDCPVNATAITAAAAGIQPGCLACIEYLREQGCHWDETATSAAASHGAFDILSYLHDKGCPLDKTATEQAARHGMLRCLRYLIKKGCPQDETATSSAAQNGDLQCLRLLREKGKCAWDDRVWSKSPTDTALLPVTEYLLDNDAPLPTEPEFRRQILATPAGVRRLRREFDNLLLHIGKGEAKEALSIIRRDEIDLGLTSTVEENALLSASR